MKTDQMTAHVGLSAHLLSGAAGYRRAGIHGYIYHVLAHLTEADPGASPCLRYTVFVGAGTPPEDAAFTVRRSRFTTERPLRRILWEQGVQPWQLGGLDLLHGLAFVTPLLAWLPTVVTVYDLSFVHYPERLPASRRLYLRLFTGLSARRARRVIAISASTAADVTRVLGVPRERIDVAVPGVGAHFRPQTAAAVADFRARQGLPERFLLHLGTLEPRKNLPVLLAAYARLPESLRRDVPLVLVGGLGWGVEPIRATIERLSLGDSVRLAGYAPDDDLALWYSAAAAFALPSVYEGWGMPVVEAMACGTPVLVSDVSSLPEAAGDAGLRLPPDDVDAWADGLHTALTDSSWRAAARERGRARAAGFTWEQAARVHVESYRAALK
ncbi:MAG: glycosyltransferase family 4 protein [Anaerolineae bacterium]|nr:glycosyltransferase family 4 protein [Anaerolineae bacterium]